GVRGGAWTGGGGGPDAGARLPGGAQPLGRPRPVRQRVGADRRPVRRRPPLLRDPQGGLLLPDRRAGLRGPPGHLRPPLAGAAPRGAPVPDRLLPPGRGAACGAPPALPTSGRRPRPQPDDRLPMRPGAVAPAGTGGPPVGLEGGGRAAMVG